MTSDEQRRKLKAERQRSWRQKKSADPAWVARERAYGQSWRARRRTDPSWIERERARSRKNWRKQWNDPLWRAQDIERKRLGRQGYTDPTPIPLPYTGHPLLEQARALVGGTWIDGQFAAPIFEDAAGAVVVALVEGRDPQEALREFWRVEGTWRHKTVPYRP